MTNCPDTSNPSDASLSRRERRWTWAVSIALVLAVFAVFGQTVRFDFINFDDNVCIYRNPRVFQGLTKQNITWAFTQKHVGTWQPLTWLSLMADCEIFGLQRPGGFHFTNVLLHALTAVLLFLVLRQMTGRLWPCAFAAALFAVHPLRAESVAWVTERKDVLSGVFFMLVLGAYVAYARRPSSLLRYAAVMTLLALGLMAKPILVTVPCLLLLLDFWPLGRMAGCGAAAAASPRGVLKNVAWLVLEKIPLFALVGLSCAATFWAQREALVWADYIPWPRRIGGAILSYVAYLGRFFYPLHLAVAYPWRDTHTPLPMWHVLGAAALLAGVTAAVVVAWRRHPYGLVGWFWYLGVMLPVILGIQIGPEADPDRFTYLPQIGIGIALAWAVADWTRTWRRQGAVCGLAAVAVLLALAARAAWQTSYWRDSATLWRHTLEFASANPIAHGKLGLALAGQGQFQEAIDEFQTVLRINPQDAGVHGNLGAVLGGLGRFDEAIAEFRESLRIDPDDAEVHDNLGAALARVGRVDEAIAEFRAAVKNNPHDAEAHGSLGATLAGLGRMDEAVAEFRAVLETNPRDAETRRNLGLALAGLGRFDEAAAAFQEALKVNPRDAVAHGNLGAALAGLGRFDEAVAEYRAALKIDPHDAVVYNNLGLALTRLGRVDEAVAEYEKVLKINPNDAGACNSLASIRATYPEGRFRDGAAAVTLARRAVKLSPNDPTALDTLAAAYAEAGRFPEAVRSAEQAIRLATIVGNRPLADQVRRRLELYRKGRPYRQPAAR